MYYQLIIINGINAALFVDTDDGEWGDEDEWEWESEEEEAELPEPFPNGTTTKENNEKLKLSSPESLHNGINIAITE